MAIRANNDERAIVNAFLRTGHPWMAFATVVLKTGVRIVIACGVIAAVISQGQGLAGIVETFWTLI